MKGELENKQQAIKKWAVVRANINSASVEVAQNHEWWYIHKVQAKIVRIENINIRFGMEWYWIFREKW